MGTRSSLGFIIDGQYKAQYNQFDGYPSGLGVGVVNFIRLVKDWDQFKENARKVVLVDESVPATKELQLRYQQYSDLGVSNQRLDDWYCLLRNLQGEVILHEIEKGAVSHMLDGTEFIKDSLFCEYAYILNLDTMEFEIYEGFQKSPDPGNRYGEELALNGRGEPGEYYPCKLVATFPLTDIPKDWLQQVNPEEVKEDA